MTEKTLFLTVNSLKLDLKNPRFNGIEFKNEDEAIAELFALFDNSRFLNLAEDIMSSGLNPSEAFLVMLDRNTPKKYIVLEGNRRLTCLILLSDPQRAPTPYIKSKIEEILKKFPNISPQRIQVICSVMDSRIDADKWIDLKHADTNKKGLKTEEWPSNTRALRGSSKENPELYFQFIEILKESSIVPGLIVNIISNLPRTNITRLFGFSAVRTLLNYTFLEGVVELPIDDNDQNETLKNISKVLLHIYDQKLGVSSFKNAKQAEELVRSILLANTITLINGKLVISDDFKYLYPIFDQVTITQTDSSNNNLDNESGNSQGHEPSSNQNNESGNNQGYEPSSNQNNESGNNQGHEPSNNQDNVGSKKPTISKPSYLDQKYLINYVLNIPERKINEIYRELKRMPLEEFLYSISITFRAFLELSCDWYIYKQKNNQVIYRYPKEGNDRAVNEGSQLSKKLDGIAHHFHTKGLLNKKQLEAAKLIADETGTGTINWLHSCVHNYTKLITKSDILAVQNDLKPFLESIWNK